MNPSLKIVLPNKRRGCFLALFLLLLSLSAMWAFKAAWDARYYAGYAADLPLGAVIEESTLLPDYRRERFVYTGLPDTRVPGSLALPIATDPPYPCLVFLHGIGQDKTFLDDIAAPFVHAGFAMVTFDQYTRGERRLPPDASPLREALALRRRGALTVIETRRLLDYLVTRPDIDPGRIYLLGASFGAITGCTAAAFDPRLSAVVLTYGGGDFSLLLPSEQARQALGKWTPLAAWAVSHFLAPADPVRYVDRIAPRPMLFQNGTRDTLIPPAAAQALFDAAREPKDLVWYDSDHIGLDKTQVQRVIADTVAWLKQIEDATI